MSTKRKFTEQMLERIRPPQTGRVVFTDTITPGLQLRITENGTKTFSVIYKVPGEGGLSKHGRLLTDQQHRITLGRWPIAGLHRTRERAREILSAAADGRDPRAERRAVNAARHTATFAATVERFVELYAKPNVRSWKNIEATFRLHVIPRWGSRPLSDITRGDIHDLLDTLLQEQRVGVAREVRKHVRSLFTWAVERSIVANNPASSLKRRDLAYPDDDGRALQDLEIRAVWQAANKIGYAYGPLYQLLLLTGQRTADWAHARWDEIDEKEKVLVIPAHRYKTRRDHAVPLSPAVWDLLETLPRWSAGPFLFSATSASGARSVNGYSAAAPRLELLAREEFKLVSADPEAKLPHYTIKDFRKTCRTRLTALGVREEIAERVLGHAQQKLVRTYNRHEYLTEKREALDAHATHIMEIVNQ